MYHVVRVGSVYRVALTSDRYGDAPIAVYGKELDALICCQAANAAYRQGQKDAEGGRTLGEHLERMGCYF